MITQSELERRLAEVEAREAEVSRREKVVEAKSFRSNLYDRVALSPRAIDAVIIACAVSIGILVLVGCFLGRGA